MRPSVYVANEQGRRSSNLTNTDWTGGKCTFDLNKTLAFDALDKNTSKKLNDDKVFLLDMLAGKVGYTEVFCIIPKLFTETLCLKIKTNILVSTAGFTMRDAKVFCVLNK